MVKMFSSESEEWETPQEFFDKLDAFFHFTLDPCASDRNHKCEKYFTKEQNGLLQPWFGERVFMNPPYGDKIKFWMEKADAEAETGTTVVCLIPARTDTKWWNKYVTPWSIIFLEGRLKFLLPDRETFSAPFPSAVVIMSKNIYLSAIASYFNLELLNCFKV